MLLPKPDTLCCCFICSHRQVLFVRVDILLKYDAVHVYAYQWVVGCAVWLHDVCTCYSTGHTALCRFAVLSGTAYTRSVLVETNRNTCIIAARSESDSVQLPCICLKAWYSRASDVWHTRVRYVSYNALNTRTAPHAVSLVASVPLGSN
jgi:hypothetical protein